MWVIVGGSQRAQRWEPGAQIVIGSAARCEIVLSGDDVASGHVSIEVGVDSAIITALDTSHPTFIDGRPVRRPTLVREACFLGIADHLIALRFDEDVPVELAPPFVVTESATEWDETEMVIVNPPFAMTYNPPPIPTPHHQAILTAPEPASEVEAGFLAALRDAPDDVQTRLVYADWLEENWQVARSTLLRFELKLHALPPEHAHTRLIRERLRVLLANAEADAGWRALVLRPLIETCNEESFAPECPRRWSALPLGASETPAVRTCASCQRGVRFCATYGDVAAAAGEGEHIVLDPPLERDVALELYASRV